MTNEKAIKWIERFELAFPLPIEDYIDAKEALDMAIKALEQQSSDDCISREEAIRVAEQGQIQGYEWQFKKLCTLPSVTPIISKMEQVEDCISRKAVEEITWEEPSYTDALNAITEIRDKIRQLPSVTPQPKIRYWIDRFGGCECSECGCLEAGYSDYCPNCGAKMEVEDKESEE